jgi:type I restriction enzyme S subunit
VIEGLEPYSAYKDSGVPWLGKVPAHWDLRSLASLTSAISQRGRPDLPLLSVVREKGVTERSTMSDEENHNFVPDDLGNYKVVSPSRKRTARSKTSRNPQRAKRTWRPYDG